MNKTQQKRFDSLYQQHLTALKRQGKSDATINAYSRAVRRIGAYFDRCPDQLTVNDLKDYFTRLVQSHSWSTVKIAHNGLQFFYKQVLNKQWKSAGSGTLASYSPMRKSPGSIQLPLIVVIPNPEPIQRRAFRCPCCRRHMRIVALRPPAWGLA